MSSIVFNDEHCPCSYNGILGCDGYGNAKSIICLSANGDNNFIYDGIVEGSILFVDTTSKFKRGNLNVFKMKSNISPQYKLSKTRVADAIYIGKVILAFNQY